MDREFATWPTATTFSPWEVFSPIVTEKCSPAGGVLLWFGTLVILGGQLIAVARIFQAIVGAPKALGCLLGGLLVIVYLTAGGLKGTVRINAIQLTVKGAGFSLALPFALGYAGGWDGMRQRILDRGIHRELFLRSQASEPPQS